MSDAVDPNPSNGGDTAEPTEAPEPPPPPPAVEGEGSTGDAAADASSADVAVSTNPASPEVEDGSDDEDDDDDDDDEDDDEEPEDDDEMGDAEDDEMAGVGVNEFLSLLPPSVLPRVEHLRKLDARRDEVLEEYRKERAELEKKFSAMMKPLYLDRRNVVSGVKDEEIAREAKEEKKKAADGDERADADEAGEDGDDEMEDAKGVPQFWACAMGHVDVIAELITEADVDCLDFLTDVECVDFEDGSGFELIFHFSEGNTYFANRTLTKRYEVPNLLTEDEPILKNVSGTEITWKSGRSLTYREVTRKQRKKGGRGAGQIRTVSKRERTDSFFHFFSPPEMPDVRDVMDEEEADAVEDAFDHDYDVAQAFRGHLIPRAIKWFTGEALEDFDEDLVNEMLEEGNGGDGPEGGPVQFNFGGAAPAAPGPFPPPAQGDGENPECKQN